MDTLHDVLRVLDEVLSLGGRAVSFTRDTPLLGAIPEFDSMAVVNLIGAPEDRFGIAIDDDELEGSTFANIGAVVDLVDGKLSA